MLPILLQPHDLGRVPRAHGYPFGYVWIRGVDDVSHVARRLAALVVQNNRRSYGGGDRARSTSSRPFCAQRPTLLASCDGRQGQRSPAAASRETHLGRIPSAWKIKIGFAYQVVLASWWAEERKRCVWFVARVCRCMASW